MRQKITLLKNSPSRNCVKYPWLSHLPTPQTLFSKNGVNKNTSWWFFTNPFEKYAPVKNGFIFPNFRARKFLNKIVELLPSMASPLLMLGMVFPRFIGNSLLCLHKPLLFRLRKLVRKSSQRPISSPFPSHPLEASASTSRKAVKGLAVSQGV